MTDVGGGAILDAAAFACGSGGERAEESVTTGLSLVACLAGAAFSGLGKAGFVLVGQLAAFEAIAAGCGGLFGGADADGAAEVGVVAGLACLAFGFIAAQAEALAFPLKVDGEALSPVGAVALLLAGVQADGASTWDQVALIAVGAGAIDTARAAGATWRVGCAFAAHAQADVPLGGAQAVVSLFAGDFAAAKVEVFAATGLLADLAAAFEALCALGALLAGAEDAAIFGDALTALAGAAFGAIFVAAAGFAAGEWVECADTLDVIGLGTIVVGTCGLGLKVHHGASKRAVGKADGVADLVVGDLGEVVLVAGDAGDTPGEGRIEVDPGAA